MKTHSEQLVKESTLIKTNQQFFKWRGERSKQAKKNLIQSQACAERTVTSHWKQQKLLFCNLTALIYKLKHSFNFWKTCFSERALKKYNTFHTLVHCTNNSRTHYTTITVLKMCIRRTPLFKVKLTIVFTFSSQPRRQSGRN